MKGWVFQTKALTRALRARGWRPRFCGLFYLLISLCFLAGTWAGTYRRASEVLSSASVKVGGIPAARSVDTAGRKLGDLDIDSLVCVDDRGRAYVLTPGRKEITVFSADGAVVARTTLQVPAAGDLQDGGAGQPQHSGAKTEFKPAEIFRGALNHPADLSAADGGPVWLLGAGGEVVALALDGSLVAWFLTPGPEEPAWRAWAKEVAEKGLRGVKWPDDIEGVDWPEEPPSAVLGSRIFALDRAGAVKPGGVELLAGCKKSGDTVNGDKALVLVCDVLLDASGYSRRFAVYGSRDGRPLTPFYGFRFDYKGRVHPTSGASAPLIFEDIAVVPGRVGAKRELVVLSAGKGGSVVLRWLEISAPDFAVKTCNETIVPGLDSREAWLAGVDGRRRAYIATHLPTGSPSSTDEVHFPSTSQGSTIGQGNSPGVVGKAERGWTGSAPAMDKIDPGRHVVIRIFDPSGELERQMELERVAGQQVRVDREGNVYALVAKGTRAQLIRWEARR